MVAARQRRSRRSPPAASKNPSSPVPAPSFQRHRHRLRPRPHRQSLEIIALPPVLQRPFRHHPRTHRHLVLAQVSLPGRHRPCHEQTPTAASAARSARPTPSCEVACAKDIEAVIESSTSGAIAGMSRRTHPGRRRLHRAAQGVLQRSPSTSSRSTAETSSPTKCRPVWAAPAKSWFGIEHWEVKPDILTAAKSLGNGFPIGLTVATPGNRQRHHQEPDHRYLRRQPPRLRHRLGRHRPHRRGRPSSATATSSAPTCRDGLLELQKKYPVIGEVRGLGLMQACSGTRRRSEDQGACPQTRQRDAPRSPPASGGLLIGKGGPYNNVLRMSPPMNIAKSDVDEALRFLDQSFAAVTHNAMAAV